MDNRLWYQTPSQGWMEGLPIGNGRMAAMIWGEEDTDRVSLNHEWLWRGVNRDRDNDAVSEHLDDVRECLQKGDFFRATSVANAWLGGHGGISKLPNRVDAYQPAGDLVFTLHDCASFEHRELDIDRAVAAVRRRTGDGSVESRFLAHPGCGLIMARWQGTAPFSGMLSYSRVPDPGARESCVYGEDCIEYACAFDGGIEYQAFVTVKTDGHVTAGQDGLTITGASHMTAFINIATSVKGIEKELADYPVPDASWEELLVSHSAAFSELLGRICLDIALPPSEEPTDRRIEHIRRGGEDPALPLLYFNYGRYLLASSSIGGELPANLQGKWNDRIDPPWDCDYHFDINLQMNYWMAEAAAMPECALALLRYVESYIPHARKAAADLYGCRGVWLPIQSDAWGRATPESFGWSVWVGAAPWMAQHFWWHYIYSGDMDFLGERAYPFFREVAMFFEDYLVEDADGMLQVMPSQSPENRFEGTGLWPVSLGISAAMDIELIYDVLGYALRAAEILDVDEADRERWKSMQDRLPPFAIGSDGRLLEWDIERTEIEPGHRHLSHLYGLYPSDLFNPLDRPRQYEAAMRSLDHRLSQGGGHTGWSRAWVACLSARLGRSGDMWHHFYSLITDFATVSLLDLHPPRIFQIDGNLGAVEAVLQSLVQCWGGKVHLLRALPAAWPQGSLRGIRVPGGHSLSLSWREGQVHSVEIILGYEGQVVLGGLAGSFILPEGTADEDGDIRITGSAGTVISLYRA